MYTIRRMRSSDSAAFLDLVNTTDVESDFMTGEPGERQLSPFQVTMAISSGMQVIFIAEENEKLLGQISLFYMLGRGKRVKHAVHIGISVLQSVWGKGIGAALMQAAEVWARNEGIIRMELTVMTHNERGIALYKKMGFEIEGTKKATIFVNGKYVDEYLMSKILGN